jgi:hypothetical protein
MGKLFQFLYSWHFILYSDLLRQTIIKSPIVGSDLQFKQLVSLRAGSCSVITGIGGIFKGKKFPFSKWNINVERSSNVMWGRSSWRHRNVRSEDTTSCTETLNQTLMKNLARDPLRFGENFPSFRKIDTVQKVGSYSRNVRASHSCRPESSSASVTEVSVQEKAVFEVTEVQHSHLEV